MNGARIEAMRRRRGAQPEQQIAAAQEAAARQLQATFDRRSATFRSEQLNARLPEWLSNGTPAQTRRRIALINGSYVLLALALLLRFVLCTRGYCSSNVTAAERSWWVRCKPCPKGAECLNGQAHCGNGWVPYHGSCVRNTEEGRKEQDLMERAQQLLSSRLWYYNRGCARHAGYTWDELGTRLVGRAAMAANTTNLTDENALLKRVYQSAASANFGDANHIAVTAGAAERQEYRTDIEVAQRLSLCQLKVLLVRWRTVRLVLGVAGALAVCAVAVVRHRNNVARKAAREIADQVWLVLVAEANRTENVPVSEVLLRQTVAPDANDAMWESVVSELLEQGAQRIGYLSSGVLRKYLCL